ncbi:MAG: DUF6391 domain-containing protein [Chloroflexota bacterium]
MLTLLNEIVRRTRQHHAIEHATIHLLSSRNKSVRLSGLSDPTGFVIYGGVEEEEVRQAVGDALLRLQAGEKTLAIHPNCGTNLVTTALLTTFAALLATSGKRRTVADKFGLALPMMLVAIVVSKPLGLYFQEYTTLADVSDRWVVDVSSQKVGRVVATRVTFE